MKTNLITIFCFCNLLTFAQDYNFSFQNEILSNSEDYIQLNLDKTIICKLNDQLSDIRVIGVDSSGDERELAYLINSDENLDRRRTVLFRTINQSKDKAAYYYTFSLDKNQVINEISLDFNLREFDWKISLSGSNDQKKWYNILDDYRLVSHKSQEGVYRFLSLYFKPSEYKFYRIRIPHDKDPEFVNAQILMNTNSRSDLIPIGLSQNEKLIVGKKSEIYFETECSYPIVKLNFEVEHEGDFIRKARLYYLNDSLYNGRKWEYSYRIEKSFKLSSFDKNELVIKPNKSRRYKVVIDNFDNQALSVTSISAFGIPYRIVTKFPDEGRFFLRYGQKEITKPKYDMQLFADKIPKELDTANFGSQTILKSNSKSNNFIFDNPRLIWAITILIILTLGYFLFKMFQSS